MSVTIKKNFFDLACSKTLQYLSISLPIEEYSFTSASNLLLKDCWASNVDAVLHALLDLRYILGERTKSKNARTNLLRFSISFVVKPLDWVINHPVNVVW